MEVYILNELGIRPWEVPLLTPQDKNDLLGMRALRIESDEYEHSKSKGKNVGHISKQARKAI